MIHKAIIMMGGNVGDVKGSLRTVCQELEDAGVQILQKSALYSTEPWGDKNQDPFINQAIVIRTTLLPSSLLDLLLDIERQHGRIREKKYAARTLDLDILYYDDWVIKHPYLEIPHPRISERNFCLRILQDLDPTFIDPSSGIGISQLLKDCGDDCKVELLPA